MAIIGIFSPEKNGGWVGGIKTLTIDTKVRFVPNDNRENDRAPDFRIFAGQSELGAAWARKGSGENPREYLSVKIDDPSLQAPVIAAMFYGEEGKEAQLVWNRCPDKKC